MKKLPAAKRNQLILVAVGTLILLAGVYFGLIQPQQNDNRHLLQQANDQQASLEKYHQTIREALNDSNVLAQVSADLEHQEKDVASGDAYAWIYDTIHHFKVGYHVDIPNIGQPVLGEMDMFPNFPYKQVRLSIYGSGYFHDIGKFVADFENTFPHIRIENLAIASSDSGTTSSELLSFHFDVVALVKPTS